MFNRRLTYLPGTRVHGTNNWPFQSELARLSPAIPHAYITVLRGASRPNECLQLWTTNRDVSAVPRGVTIIHPRRIPGGNPTRVNVAEYRGIPLLVWM